MEKVRINNFEISEAITLKTLLIKGGKRRNENYKQNGIA